MNWRKIVRVWNTSKVPTKILLFTVLCNVVIYFYLAITMIIRRGTEEKCFQDVAKTIVIRCTAVYSVNQAVIFMVWSVFFAVNVLHGVLNDNLYELYAGMLQAIFFTIYSIFRAAETYPKDDIDYIFVITASVCQIVYFALAKFLRQEYSWRLYKKAGADKTEECLKLNLLWIALIKLDTQCALFSTVLSGDGILNKGWRLVVNCIMYAATFLFLGIGYVSVKFENRVAAVIFYFLFPVAPAYVVFFFIDHWNKCLEESSFSERNLIALFSVAGSFTMLLHLILLALSIQAHSHFGKGWRRLQELFETEPDPLSLNENNDNDDEDSASDANDYYGSGDEDDDFKAPWT